MGKCCRKGRAQGELGKFERALDSREKAKSALEDEPRIKADIASGMEAAALQVG